MGQHPDRFDFVLPHADPQAVQPRQSHQTKESLQPLGLRDASALQVEASGLVTAKRAFHGPPELVQVPRFSDTKICGDDDEIPIGGSRGHHPHPFPEDPGGFRNHTELARLEIIEPLVCWELVQNSVLSDANGPANTLPPEEAEPLCTDEFPVSHEALPARRWKGLQELKNDPHACPRIAVARMVESHPDERDSIAVHDGTQDEEVQGSVSVLPGRPVQAHQNFSRWEVDQDQGQEDLRSELFIMDGAFYAPFFGFGRTGSREVRTEISVVDALCGDHREDEIDNALEGINTEQGDAGLPGR